MKRDFRHIFNIGVVLVVLGAVVLAMGFTRQARLLPLSIGIPLLILAIAQMLIDFYKVWTDKKKSVPAEKKTRGDRSLFLKEINISLWVLGLFGSIYIFGFIATAFFYTLLYLKLHSGCGWKISLGVSAGSLVFLYVVLISAFGLSLHDGIAITALRKAFITY